VRQAQGSWGQRDPRQSHRLSGLSGIIEQLHWAKLALIFFSDDRQDHLSPVNGRADRYRAENGRGALAADCKAIRPCRSSTGCHSTRSGSTNPSAQRSGLNDRSGSILRASIRLANQLYLACCVEGIETEEAAIEVASLVADEIQSYWIGKPQLFRESGLLFECAS
jgi:hypothetical protein